MTMPHLKANSEESGRESSKAKETNLDIRESCEIQISGKMISYVVT